ncbi:MAG: polymer-forming cytoskeletal protein [Bacteroidales bacterium]|nr:polymer-forming cytoskeletal protein [Bacteroidales bacterium]
MSKSITVPPEGIHNQLIPGTTIHGDIITEGDIKIDGQLIGKLETTGRMVIGETGSVEGEVVCASAQISGSVKGKIHCQELLSLKSTAQFVGNIITAKLSIEPGAQFSGYCSMPNDPSGASASNGADFETL